MKTKMKNHPSTPAMMQMNDSCLHGRTAEESILLNSYFASLSLSSSSSDAPASVILIRGDSGVGKSKIAESLRPHVLEDDGYFIRGKFDQSSYCGDNRLMLSSSPLDNTNESHHHHVNSPHVPYSGIASAFAEYCNLLEERGDAAWGEVADKLRREIGVEEGRPLFEAIPALKRIFTQDGNSESYGLHIPGENNDEKMHNFHTLEQEEKKQSDSSLGSRNDYTEGRSHRLSSLLKKFIHAISSVGDPIVMLIDDMQWADLSSLELLRTLIVGAKSPSMFIFTFRPIESSHPFLQMMQALDNAHIPKTEIQLRNLREDSVRELVASILSIDPMSLKEGESSENSSQNNENSDIRRNSVSLASLTDAICNITDGNPFFIRQQIIFWIDQGLLVAKEDSKWTWDIEKIKESSVLGDVVSMISEKIKKLPQITQRALAICACIGSKVDLQLIGHLVREMFTPTTPLENEAVAKNALSQALQEMLVVYTVADKTAVSFVHDSIQTAAYALIDPHDQSAFHLQLGRILRNNLAPELFEMNLFTIANQLARGYNLITNRDERVDSARTFLRAGNKAAEASAFPEAEFFYGRGICMINNDEDWIKNYRLCMDCYLKGAEAAAIAGDYDQMDDWLGVIFSRCNGLDDEFQAHYIHVRSLAQRCDMERAVDVGLEALKLIGIQIPSRRLKLHTMVELVKTRHLMKHVRLEDLFMLPPIKDKKMLSVLRLLSILCTLSLSGKKELCPLICFRSIQLNLKHGLSPGFPGSLTQYGYLLSRYGMLSEAATYCEMANDACEHLGSTQSIAQVNLVSYGIVFPFTKPLVECEKHLLDGYKIGMESGDVMHGIRCGSFYRYMSFFSGQPLDSVIDGVKKSNKIMKEHNSNSTLLVNYVYQQTASNFLGCNGASPNPAYLKGEFFDYDATERLFQQKNHSVLKEQMDLMQLFLAYYFAHYDVGWKSSEKMGKIASSCGSTLKGIIFHYIHVFYRGLTAVELTKHGTSNRRYFKAVKSCIKELKVGRKKSPLNLSHQSYLLEAEFAVLKKKYDLAEKYFSLSISHVDLTGVVHEQALIRERFGIYYMTRNNHEAAYQLIRAARDLYQKWGSQAKIEFLIDRFPHLREKERDHEEMIRRMESSCESSTLCTSATTVAA